MSRSLFVLFISMFLGLTVLGGNASGDIRNPLVHWALDGDGADSVGNNDLSIEGGDFEAGQYGLALSLDGSGAHAVDEDGADYINGLDALTVAMWIKSNQTDTDKGFFICFEPDGNDRYLCMRYDAAGSNGGGTNIIKTGVNTDQGKTTFESSNGAQTTQWQHVAMVWSSGEQIKLYIDGVQNEPTANEAALGGALSGLTEVIVGRGAKDQGGGWDGLIDDVYIYTEALSAEEIVEIEEGRALSVDAHGKLVTLWGRVKELK
jgi:hypothetical protein